ncbi:hypothetical protein NDU88_003042 [Pleurodeles waltl]|uniref:Uncharacterized protein n=1 Tax=Pleurodeles waltl TaxID=8319 RepID=A0AAV7WMX1_PLEWA|nr:hypothetical protein NDU88_003042 [Pleurodeles waltl]
MLSQKPARPLGSERSHVIEIGRTKSPYLTSPGPKRQGEMKNRRARSPNEKVSTAPSLKFTSLKATEHRKRTTLGSGPGGREKASTAKRGAILGVFSAIVNKVSVERSYIRNVPVVATPLEELW